MGGRGWPTESIHCSRSQKEHDEEIGMLVDHQEENVKKENVSTAGKSKEQVSTMDNTVKIGVNNQKRLKTRLHKRKMNGQGWKMQSQVLTRR